VTDSGVKKPAFRHPIRYEKVRFPLTQLKNNFSQKGIQTTETNTQDYQPKDLSLANTMRAIYDSLDNLNEAVGEKAGFQDQHRNAQTDRYIRKANKAARYRPKNPDKTKLGAPTIRKLTNDELKQMKQHSNQNAT